jgi:hypothetical protein
MELQSRCEKSLHYWVHMVSTVSAYADTYIPGIARNNHPSNRCAYWRGGRNQSEPAQKLGKKARIQVCSDNVTTVGNLPRSSELAKKKGKITLYHDRSLIGSFA